VLGTHTRAGQQAVGTGRAAKLEGSIKMLKIKSESGLQLTGLCGVLEAQRVVCEPSLASELASAEELRDEGPQNQV
jgi:hypothetical protein